MRRKRGLPDRPVIVTFSGTDCSGKSTQLDILAREAAARGHRVRRLWHRGGYSAEAEALKRLVRRLRPGALPPPGPGAAHDRAFTRDHVRAAWLAFACLDTFWAYAAKVRAWSAAGDLVLCDRWIWDTRIDFELRFGLALAEHPAWRVFEALLPKPDHSFLLLLPDAEVEARMERKGEQLREPVGRRAERIACYQALSARDGLRAIDARQSISAIAALVRQEVWL